MRDRLLLAKGILSGMGGILAASLAVFPAQGQDYPTKPVRLMVPWPPGGGVDIAARTLQPGISENLRQPVIVDNRAGASGLIGTELAARAPADGYTILLAAAGPNAIVPLLMPRPPYDALKAFTEVALFANTFYVMAVNPKLPVNSIKEFVAMAKAKPGLTFGTTGTGTPAFISGELLRVAAGISLTPVFYKGAALAALDVVSGQITMTIETVSPILPHVKSGRLKPLGVTASRRSSQLPDVPTIAESGYPGYEVINWYGVLAPAGTPRGPVARLYREVSEVVKTPAVRDRLVAAGLEIVDLNPEQYAAFRKADLKNWAKIIKDTNLKLD
jgi:tripartite-type tricarboxylate transporter receptor subunit TctC